MDILRFSNGRCIYDRVIHFSEPTLSPVWDYSDRSVTKNRTLEEIKLISNSGAAGQVRRIFKQSRRVWNEIMIREPNQ